MEVSAVRSAVLRDRNFSLTEFSGSKGPLWSPARTIERSQEGTRGDLKGFILLAPFRNLMMRSCFPRDRPSTASWWRQLLMHLWEERHRGRARLWAAPRSEKPIAQPRGLGTRRSIDLQPDAHGCPGKHGRQALGPVRRWRQHPRGAAPPHLHPQRTWTHPPMLRSTSYLQMAHRMKCWAPCGTDQRNHPGTGRDVRCVRSKRSVGACPAERLFQ